MPQGKGKGKGDSKGDSGNRVGHRFRVRQKVAPGLTAGTEFEVLHEEKGEDHVIVTVREPRTAVVDGRITKADMGTNHRIRANALETKCEPCDEAEESSQ